MIDPLPLLTRKSSNGEIAAAIQYVAGMPRHLQHNLVREIRERTTHAETELGILLSRERVRRESNDFPRLKLATMLGVESGSLIDDPLMPGEQIIVRDAKLLGHEPIVTKLSGYAHHTNTYVVALAEKTGKAPKDYMIAERDIERQARMLEDCDEVRHVPPRMLATANVGAFDALAGRIDNAGKPLPNYQRLRITLAMNRRFVLVENGGGGGAFAAA